jgi:Ca2+-binding EF-hand superfamily protein
MKAYDEHAEDDYRKQFKKFADSSTNRITKEDFHSTLLKLGMTFDATLFEEKVRTAISRLQYPDCNIPFVLCNAHRPLTPTPHHSSLTAVCPLGC